MSNLPPPTPGGSSWPPAPPAPPSPPLPPYGYGAPSPYGATGWPPTAPSWGPAAPFAYAGFWTRVGARLLDGLLGLAIMLPFLAAGIPLLVAGLDCESVRVRGGGTEWQCNSVDNGGAVAGGALLLLAGAVLWAILFIRWWSKGQTPGMKAVGTRLVRVGTLQPIGVGRATGRFFASYLSGWACYLGYLWMLWDPQKRTWHDMMCETIVVKA